ncbi:hypothetical protein BDA96_07G044700 [Sorghum bicolor]|uniref:BED-type domain-containing protein n=1 Tax=Sorghum bicolor TaxID=4558 RepID=A0A921QJ28_SORBI|nr:hypothetical protein BDA96_07G044700 [Sorghum bicolor]
MSEEDEIIEMTENEEMRLCGLTRDDEDDLFGDAEELLGRRAAEELFEGSAAHPHLVDDDVAPIEVHAADGAANSNASAADGNAGVADASSTRGKRPSTSKCWEDFEKLFKKVDGKEVRYGARCLHCRKEYTVLVIS